MEELMKMLAKKKNSEGKMSDEEIQAKMDVIKELLEMADGEMGHRVKSGMDSMNKITVAAPDAESLEAGLEKAQDLIEKSEDEESEVPESMESDDSESEPSPAVEAMASVDDSYEDDMNPFNKKHKMMMEKKAKV